MTAQGANPRGPRDLVLLGAGHAHVEVMRSLALRPLTGLRLTLVTGETRTLYSGMLPGVVRGDYARAEAELDCAALAERAGARLVTHRAVDIDFSERRLMLEGHPPVAFDVLSIDVGGHPPVPQWREGAPEAIAIKPVGRFLDALGNLVARMPCGGRLAVVGAGAGGAELALALAVRQGAVLTLITGVRGLLADAPKVARNRVGAALEAAGVTVVVGPVAGTAPGGLRLACGTAVPAWGAIWATGVVAPEFLRRAGLACDAQGCVRVHATLESVSHPGVFAAGDCACLDDDPRPKAGVWAVRAGAPLVDNLRRLCAGRMLRAWRPGRDGLVMVGLGGGRAVAWRGRLVVGGRLAWWCKDRIDRRYIARSRPA